MFEKVEFTNMCMICDESKVLVIDRKKKDWPGVTFPGGHVELGESFVDAVIREIHEETGLKIYSPQLCGIKDWFENHCRYVVFFIRRLVMRESCILLRKAKFGGRRWIIFPILTFPLI